MDTRWRNTNIQSYYDKYVRRNWSYDPKIIAPYKYSYLLIYLLTMSRQKVCGWKKIYMSSVWSVRHENIVNGTEN